MAATCPKCGHPLQAQAESSLTAAGTTTTVVVQSQPSGGIAAVLSFFIPGLGQLYKGSMLGGLCWFIFTVIGYCMLFVPGIVLHLLCIAHALLGGAALKSSVTRLPPA